MTRDTNSSGRIGNHINPSFGIMWIREIVIVFILNVVEANRLSLKLVKIQP